MRSRLRRASNLALPKLRIAGLCVRRAENLTRTIALQPAIHSPIEYNSIMWILYVFHVPCLLIHLSFKSHDSADVRAPPLEIYHYRAEELKELKEMSSRRAISFPSLSLKYTSRAGGKVADLQDVWFLRPPLLFPPVPAIFYRPWNIRRQKILNSLSVYIFTRCTDRW